MRSVLFGLWASILLAIAIISSDQIANATEVSCLNEEGKPVDWYIAYKFPKIKGADGLFASGEAYSYITSDDIEQGNEIFTGGETDSALKQLESMRLVTRSARNRLSKKRSNKGERQESAKWVASDIEISDPNSIVMRTLAVAHDKNSRKLNSVYYNDNPDGTDGIVYSKDEKPKYNERRAHAKGVLLMDDISGDGVWLTHSVPRFPTIRRLPLEYPRSGKVYGQTFMCISFKVAESGEQVVKHLANVRPLVYDVNFTDKMLASIPDLKWLDLEENTRRRRRHLLPNLEQTITTKGGQVLHLFSKSVSFDQDMYSGWIDKEIGSDLYVETWRNGNGGVLNSSCPKSDFRVNNVQDLKYNEDLQWSYSQDHSKWAISTEGEVGVVCIGDSNRVASQFKRGGGAVCIKCPTCWNIFSNTIQDVQPCPVNEGSDPNSNGQ